MLALPLYLPFVALPSFLPLVIAHHPVLKAIVLVVLTVTAAWAGVAQATSESSTAGLLVLWIPYVAIPLAAMVWLGQAVAARHGRRGRTTEAADMLGATVSDRLAALVIDAALVGAALFVPLRGLSRSGHDAEALLIGVTVATTYLATLVALRGQTVGQAILGLAVLDARAPERLGPLRAAVRSLLVVVEVVGAPTGFLAPLALAEVVAVLAGGRSFTDRLLATTVVARR
ncbi:MAG: RDD family protein [Acidimicrobiia bacterium]|nr:RDD family protein [Acidimicrobiia bacterium]